MSDTDKREFQELKRKLAGKGRQKAPRWTRKNLLSTGSTQLNLACSGKTYGGFPKGEFIFFVGDSMSGKTFFSLTCLAEANLNPAFANHRFIYDAPEGGALMDMEHFFGRGVADRLEPPARDRQGNPVHSATIEEFYYHLHDATEVGRPFIYILDSMDSLDSREDEDKFAEQKKAFRNGKKAKGSYGTGKAKANSANLRKVFRFLRRTGSILLIISQTRDNIDFGFEPKTRAGGKALRFYAAVEIWSSVKEKIKRTVRGKPRTVGMVCRLQVKKNRVVGNDVFVEVPFYKSRGIDDIGGCVGFLVEEDHWKSGKKKGEEEEGPAKKEKGKESVSAPEFGFVGNREGLVQKIEAEGRERELRDLVGSVWAEIEEACIVERKRRYE